MTISAKAEDRTSLLDQSLEIYRDLSLALRGHIIALREGAVAGGDDAKKRDDLIKSHQAALSRVLDIEVGLGKRTQARGGGVELDLDAARAEIRERLAQWSASR